MRALSTGTCSSPLTHPGRHWIGNRTESINFSTDQCFWTNPVRHGDIIQYILHTIRLYIYISLPDPVAEATDLIPKIPYYLSCNRERFPYWFGHPDKRNGDFLDKIKQFKKMKGFVVRNKCPFLFNLAYVTVNVTSFGAVFTCPDDT